MKNSKSNNPNGELTINHTDVFTWNLEAYEAGKRFIINQGGSRSSKTYSICQLLVYLAIQERLIISIVRKTLPDLKGSVMKDFFEILKELNLYNEANHNKTDNTYTFSNGSQIQFYGLDSEQKMRGRKRDIAYLNEANELSSEEFLQLNLRTSKTLFIDFNPSDSEHFLYDLITDERAVLIKSTYKDNTFLSPDQVQTIEDLIKTDINAYRVYALGERPINQTRIYNHFQKYVDEPDYTDWCYGLDFGFSHPMALVKVMYGDDNRVYIRQLVYESKLTSSQLIDKMNAIFKDSDRGKPVYCDYSRPELIEDLKNAGFNALIANKSVKDGIDYVKTSEVYVHADSSDIWKEYKLYSYKSVGDVISEEPIKENDDAMDAIRYALFTRKKKGSGKWDYEYVFI
ncbi:MAG: PBSX family phage terminase large subunit [Bacteroidetes bacterium]|nr:PBSX family phage terminase large subunit [Bacteroidota bacterium]